jgi:uncharacterized membrane protein
MVIVAFMSNSYWELMSCMCVILLSGLGFANALSFNLAMRGKLVTARLIPSFCKPDAGTCSRITDTPQARLFGVSLYLAWHLFFRLRMPCSSCFFGRTVNLLIAITVTLYALA